MAALALSEKFPFLDLRMLESIIKKCQELGATGIIPELIEPNGFNGSQQIRIHFVKSPDYEAFEDIKESFNPSANIFLWTEVVASTAPLKSFGEVEIAMP